MPSVFISYVKEDFKAISRIADVLCEFDVKVWVDKKTLQPGLRWQEQIRKAIATGDFFVAAFSKAYLKRDKAYMNEELVLAIEQLRQRPTERAWFIPLKLNRCKIPDRYIGAGESLHAIQWIDFDTNWADGMEKLLSVVVPGSEHIPRLIEQLDNPSARRRTEAVEALGRLGTLAAKALPALLERIPKESKSPLGLLPLAAINETLKKIGHGDDPAVFAQIEAIFASWGQPITAASARPAPRSRTADLDRLITLNREIANEVASGQRSLDELYYQFREMHYVFQHTLGSRLDRLQTLLHPHSLELFLYKGDRNGVRGYVVAVTEHVERILNDILDLEDTCNQYSSAIRRHDD